MSHHHEAPNHAGCCQDCDTGQMARNNYFTGKLMVERDFTDEQRYFRGKDQRHNQYLHGSGVVCGLKVVEHPNPDCRSTYVIIEPGVAIDCCGHEILVPDELRGALNGAKGVLFNFGQHPKIQKLRQMAQTSSEVISPEEGPPRENTRRGATRRGENLPRHSYKLQFCVRYKECPTEEIPVLYDECGCDDTKCAPNRILESYEFDILISDEPPVERVPQPEPGHAGPTEPAEKECCELFWNSLDGCPHCDTADCIVLATVEHYDPGDQLSDPDLKNPPQTAKADDNKGIARIDNRTERRLLPSTQRIVEVVKCLCEHGSKGTNGKDGKDGEDGEDGKDGKDGKDGEGLQTGLTQIIELSWEHNVHGNELHLIKKGAGNLPFTQGFGLVISFSKPVKVTAPLLTQIESDHVFQVSSTALRFAQILHPSLLGAVLDGLFKPPIMPLHGDVYAVKPVAGTPKTWETVLDASSRDIAFVFHTLVAGKKLGWTTESPIFRLFDELRVALHGDFVIDENGFAADVEHARAERPTGDRPNNSNLGVQGGLFESWFWIKKPDAPAVLDPNLAPRAALIQGMGIRAATAKKIETERGKRPFDDLADFRARVKPTPSEWERMKDSVVVLPTLFR